MPVPLTLEQVEALKSFDTCEIADAVESFGVRLHNEGFAVGGFRCLFKNLPPTVGYAVTCKVRATDPPIAGSQYRERADWWQHITETPAPRVVVMQDLDNPPGTGAYFGKVHANVFVALGCVGAVTNGAARELPGVEAAGFQVFARRLAVSRAYIHIVEYGHPVELGHLTIKPGDLIHGDRHGVLLIPPEIVADIPMMARAIRDKKRQVIELVKTQGVTPDDFRRGLKEVLEVTPDSIANGAKPWK